APLDRARGVAVHLERFRRVLTAVVGHEPENGEPPTIVIAFRDQGSFEPYLPVYRGRLVDVQGYFAAGQDADYIAAGTGTPEAGPYETVGHEYPHVHLNRTLGAQPLWLAEGLAEVLSRWTASGSQALVGLPADDHLRRLQRDTPLPMGDLLRLDSTS